MVVGHVSTSAVYEQSVAITQPTPCGEHDCLGTVGEGAFNVNPSKLQYAGAISGSGTPLGVPEYDSKIYWTPSNEVYFDEWMGAASIGSSTAESGTIGRIYLNIETPLLNEYLLYHERGHNLGYVHEDGGIMSYDAPDIADDTPAEPTKTIAQNSAGLQTYEWSDPDTTIIELLKAWRDGFVTDADLEYAIEQHDDDPSGMEFHGTNELSSEITILHDNPVDIYEGGLYRPQNADSSAGTYAWKHQ